MSATPNTGNPPANRADLARKILINPDLKRYIDINIDFGQTRDKRFFEDSQYRVLDFVSSVNIPCFVHDGDPAAMMTAIEIARGFNCAVGAHVAYPDPEHQGYRAIDLSPDELRAWLHVQIGGLQSMCKAKNAELAHVRPHGALYGKLLNDRQTVETLVETIHAIDPWLILIGPTSPLLEDVGVDKGLRIAPEVYLGKRYTRQGRLSPESLTQPLDASPQVTLDLARQMLDGGFGNAEHPAPAFKTFHLSPQLENVVDTAEKLCNLIGQPVNLPIAAAGPSGWL